MVPTAPLSTDSGHDIQLNANKNRSPNASSMLGHRRRRWPNIELALGGYLVVALICGCHGVPESTSRWLNAGQYLSTSANS